MVMPRERTYTGHASLVEQTSLVKLSNEQVQDIELMMKNHVFSSVAATTPQWYVGVAALLPMEACMMHDQQSPNASLHHTSFSPECKKSPLPLSRCLDFEL